MVYNNRKTALKCLLTAALLMSGWLGFSGFVTPTTDPPVSCSATFSDDKMLHGVDGPYLFKSRKGIREVRVVSNSEKEYQIQEFLHQKNEPFTFTCEVENEDKDAFTFQLRKKIKAPKTIYKQPARLLAISDIEGNFNAFYSLLVGNGVMDKNYEWTYGEGHLVLVGDFVDRGTNVTQCLWLIYKLEQEAEKHGGMVHFILGNHEFLNFQATTEYVDKKYIALAHQLSGEKDESKAYSYLMSNQRELVKWMKSKNVVERIGKTIFVHGGLSARLKTTNMALAEMNEFMRTGISTWRFDSGTDGQMMSFMTGPLGPLWYRGLVTKYKQFYQKATHKEVASVLRYYKAKQMVIGHTVAREVSSNYDGLVYRTDISFPPFKNTGLAQALLIEGENFFRVNDFGEKVLLNGDPSLPTPPTKVNWEILTSDAYLSNFY